MGSTKHCRQLRLFPHSRSSGVPEGSNGGKYSGCQACGGGHAKTCFPHIGFVSTNRALSQPFTNCLVAAQEAPLQPGLPPSFPLFFKVIAVTMSFLLGRGEENVGDTWRESRQDCNWADEGMSDAQVQKENWHFQNVMFSFKGLGYDQ